MLLKETSVHFALIDSVKSRDLTRNNAL